MTFTWRNKNGVQSSTGFILQSVAMGCFEYREGLRIMPLEGESIVAGLGDADFGFGFYPGWKTAGWKAPHDREEITSEHRSRIKANITAAMAFMNGKVEFDE